MSPETRVKIFFLKKAFRNTNMPLSECVVEFDKVYDYSVKSKRETIDYLLGFAQFYGQTVYEKNLQTMPVVAHVRSLCANNRLLKADDLNKILNISNACELLPKYKFALRFVSLNNQEEFFLSVDRLNDFSNWIRTNVVSRSYFSKCRTDKKQKKFLKKYKFTKTELRHIILDLKKYICNNGREK